MQLEDQARSTEATASHRDVLQVVEGNLQLYLGLTGRTSPDPLPRDRRFEHQTHVREIEDPRTAGRSLGPISGIGNGVGAPQHALALTQEHRRTETIGRLKASRPRASARARTA